MLKNILFLGLLSTVILVTSWQDVEAQPWLHHYEKLEEQARREPTIRRWSPGKKIPADSILAAIESGKTVIIDSCEVLGPLNKYGWIGESDTLSHFILITNTTFRDTFGIGGHYFGKYVSFQNCTFLGPTSFYECTFNDVANFMGATFEKQAFFVETDFLSTADFAQAVFNYGCCFDRDTFHQEASFGATTIKTGADFLEAKFLGPVSFNYSKCDWGVFAEAEFEGHASFRGASFQEANFLEARFGSRVDLSLKEFVDVAVSWHQLKGHLVYNPPANLKLMKYFESTRQLNDADGLYLFIKDRERRGKAWYERYPEFWLMQQTCGYGVEPVRALITSGLVILSFAICYYLIAVRESKRALRAGFKRICLKAYNALYFSVNAFVTGTPIGWAPEDTESSRKHYLFGILQTTERASGWVLLVLFVVTLTRKFIR